MVKSPIFWILVLVVGVVFFTFAEFWALVIVTVALAIYVSRTQAGVQPPPTLEDLVGRSVKPRSDEEAGLIAFLVGEIQQPVLSVETRREVQSQTLELVHPGTDDAVPFCELFPYEFRARTGVVLDPRAGGGHSVGLDRDGNGGWIVREKETWIS